MPKKRHPRRLTVSLTAITLSCLVGVGVTSFVYGQSIGETIHPAVSVGGIAIGELTVPETQHRLAHALETYGQQGISITVRGAVVQPKPYELGLSFDTAATVKQAYLVGRNNALEETFGVPPFGRTIDLPLTATLDEQQFVQYLTTLNNWFAAPVQQPRFAYNDGGLTIVPGLSGVGVALQDFSTILLTNAAQMAPTVLTLDLKKQEPVATVSQMLTLLPEATSLSTTALTLSLDTLRLKPAPEIIADWLIPKMDNGKLTLGLDEASLSNYLATVDQKIRRDPKPTFGFIAEHDGVYAYKNSAGLVVDVSETKRRLEEALFENGSNDVTIATKSLAPLIEYAEVAAPIAEGKVVSVDLTRQALFAFDNGKLVFWTRVSTGKYDSTPTGKWKIYAKTPVQVMDGPGYYLPGVKWVMPYNGDYTLHTAYWHHNFGNVMSHGCTNMYLDDANWLYDWAPIGTPVVVYKS